MKHLFSVATMVLAGSLLVAQPVMASGYTDTKYPIVLVHGLFGFNNFMGADYFYHIPSILKADGSTVFVSTVSAANSTEVRGEQLLNQLLNFKAISGAAKFNLIGHSHGSPTARYVASVRPSLVASVTSVDGVNKGSRVADVVRHVAPAGSVSAAVASTVADAFVKMLSYATGSSNLSQNTLSALDSLTTAGSTKFNNKHPAGVPSGCGEGAAVVNGIRYYSWGGDRALTNVVDPLDAGIKLMSLAFGGDANDGLVSTCSQRLGHVIRVDYNMNHLDAVNQILGLTNILETNPKTLYRNHANRLKTAGL